MRKSEKRMRFSLFSFYEITELMKNPASIHVLYNVIDKQYFLTALFGNRCFQGIR
ncbi:MAG: hypothetical protein AB2411_11495 [Mesobacillus sp.]